MGEGEKKSIEKMKEEEYRDILATQI